MKKSDDLKLEQKLYIFENKDKIKFKEEKDPYNIANLICPFRCGIYGPPSSGKTSILKNIVLQQRPFFNRIICYHLDPNTEEYSDIDVEMVDKLPDKDSISPEIKTLLICEDIPYRDLKKSEKMALDSYLRYVSSHKGVSIIMTGQDAFSTPPCFRRMINFLIIYRCNEMSSIYTLCRYMGYNKNLIEVIFDRLMKSKYDFLCIDKSGSGPELRKNLFEPIVFDTDKK